MGFGIGEALALTGQATGFIGTFMNRDMQRETNEQNRKIASEQAAFQERMARNAHQYEVEDLQKAGLNPILSVGGSGAATPAGSSATMVAPQIQIPDLMAYGISLAQLDQAQQKLNIDKQTASASIAKNLSSSEVDKMHRVLMEKGMPSAIAGKEAGEILSNMLKWMKDSVRKAPRLQDLQNQQNRDRMDALP